MEFDSQKFMQRATELSLLGKGLTMTNPMVGCVIVHPIQGIIGEGYHHQFGGPHAEVNAINNVQEKGLLNESTLYVTLEPCSHHGKTPPCVDLIIQHHLNKVVIGALDPNPKVDGLSKLRTAGIEVDILDFSARFNQINKFFVLNQLQQRAFVTIKYAQTKNGYIGSGNSDRLKITDDLTNQWVHQLRADHQGILIGSNTYMLDRPSLNVRYVGGNSPIKFVVNSSCSILPEVHKRNDNVIIVHQNEDFKDGNHLYIDSTLIGKEFWMSLLESIYMKYGIGSLLIEGGQQIIDSVTNASLWDEAFVITSTEVEYNQEKGIKSPKILGILQDCFNIKNDIIEKYIPFSL